MQRPTTATQRARFPGVRSRSAVLARVHGCALRGGTPGTNQVAGETFVMVPRHQTRLRVTQSLPHRPSLQGIPGARSRSAVWPVNHGCLLREGTPGTKQVDGLEARLRRHQPIAAACSGAPPQRRTLVCIPHLRCSGGSASRSSSSRRRAPFGSPDGGSRGGRARGTSRASASTTTSAGSRRAPFGRGARRLGGAAAAPRLFAGPAPRWRRSAASRTSWRASAAGRAPCLRRPARSGS